MVSFYNIYSRFRCHYSKGRCWDRLQQQRSPASTVDARVHCIIYVRVPSFAVVATTARFSRASLAIFLAIALPSTSLTSCCSQKRITQRDPPCPPRYDTLRNCTYTYFFWLSPAACRPCPRAFILVVSSANSRRNTRIRARAAQRPRFCAQRSVARITS